MSGILLIPQFLIPWPVRLQSPIINPPKVTAALAQGRHTFFVMFTQSDRIIYRKPIWKQPAATGVELDWVKRWHFLQNITFMTYLGLYRLECHNFMPWKKMWTAYCVTSLNISSVEDWPSFFENSIWYVICAKLCGGISPKLSVWIIFHPKILYVEIIWYYNKIYFRTIFISHDFYWSKMGFMHFM